MNNAQIRRVSSQVDGSVEYPCIVVSVHKKEQLGNILNKLDAELEKHRPKHHGHAEAGGDDGTGSED